MRERLETVAPVVQAGAADAANRNPARADPPWSGTLGLAYRAGERLRAENRRLTELEARTRELHRAFMHERRLATERVNEIRSRAEAADERVRAAEQEVGRVGAAIADAAARLTAAEERARGAQSRLRDAELWLRRIHGAIDIRTDAEPGSVDRTAPDDAASAVRDFLMPAAAETARSAAQ
jgi:hypothetical protein